MNEQGANAPARVRSERRVATLALLWALFTVSLGGCLLWILPLNAMVRGALMLALLAVQVAIWVSLRRSLVAPLRALTNVVEAYRGGDYALRSRFGFSVDALGELAHEINGLGETLYEQRLRAMEASALLDKLIGTIDVAILAFDGERRVRITNPAASRLWKLAPEEAIGKSTVELGLDGLLNAGVHTQIVNTMAGQRGRWQLTHGSFREGGLAQHLLIVTDLGQALREEERAAWQRLIRVLSHEVNNSLAPIKSLAGTLQDMLSKQVAAGSVSGDALFALRVIEQRTDSLARFLNQYSRLARLSAPRRRWVPVAPLVARIAKLEQAHAVAVEVPEQLQILVDEAQLEQALINLVKNAIEAQGDVQGGIKLWVRDSVHDLVVMVIDEGPGIANPDNLFVPFFTTKPGGSGTGLLLSRQVAEAHGGTLQLENRPDSRGAVATMTIPNAARRAQDSRYLAS